MQRSTQTDDGYGGAHLTWATIASNVPCGVMTPTPGELSATGQTLRELGHTLLEFKFKAGVGQPDVKEGDRLILNGVTWQVQDTGLGTAYNWLFLFRVLTSQNV